jgi:hypothetical protein
MTAGSFENDVTAGAFDVSAFGGRTFLMVQLKAMRHERACIARPDAIISTQRSFPPGHTVVTMV